MAQSLPFNSEAEMSVLGISFISNVENPGVSAIYEFSLYLYKYSELCSIIK